MNIVTRNVGSRTNPSLSALGIASNLAKLLPTGTVLVFETLLPSFSNNGSCLVANKVLTYILLAACTISCIVFSITDSFVGTTETGGEKIYQGIATLNGFHVFNNDENVCFDEEELKKYRITKRDFMHMLLQAAVFWVVALSDMDLQECIIAGVPGGDWREVMTNLPIGVGVVCSIFFLVFPTKRRGIGHTDMQPGVVHCTDNTSTQLPSPPKQDQELTSTSV